MQIITTHVKKTVGLPAKKVLCFKHCDSAIVLHYKITAVIAQKKGNYALQRNSPFLQVSGCIQPANQLKNAIENSLKTGFKTCINGFYRQIKFKIPPLKQYGF